MKNIKRIHFKVTTRDGDLPLVEFEKAVHEIYPAQYMVKRKESMRVVGRHLGLHVIPSALEAP